ncbi:MAG: alpha-galactosidase, partial [Oscillospiraceae bacterium]|nr:alpha-galactosidase [Oscillospiraceae bacterium]
ENDDEAQTLIVTLKDEVAGIWLELLYTLFANEGALARSARLTNEGGAPVQIERALSMCLDLPDPEYEWIQFSGAWSRERYPVCRKLDIGTTEVESLRGTSSLQQNPFIVLKRPTADEKQGDVMGFSLVYSGNFLASAQVDNYRNTRVLLGINPEWFSWKLEPGASFQTPEAVTVFSDEGLNGMSQTFHRLYRHRLARGIWRDQPRPILINNWEATYFDISEEKILKIAKKAKECGVELFVLDDGWFGKRRNDFAGLGDWYVAKDILPCGIDGLSQKIEDLGLKFGLWIEPEMVNPDSDLYRAHPDWAFCVPDRKPCLGRHQYVLDYSRPEVVDYIHGMLREVIGKAKISYIKWDMNRCVTECYDRTLPADRQGEVFHRHILGVYSLYERLIAEFPHILFESCSSGGGRFDAGMLYYAPQAWASDDTDAMERLKIQYGTSYGYPVVSMGSHVSAVPNHQLNRMTSIRTRANVALFGTFGYELDLNTLPEEEIASVREYTQFMKDHRKLIQFGTFYRLQSPFEHNEAGWMVVSEDRKEAIVGYYRQLARVNAPFTRLVLQGLDPDTAYAVEGEGTFYGDELMNAGLITSDASTCKLGFDGHYDGDFSSSIYLLKAED